MLANVDVLENEGLDADGQAKVVETADRLVEQVSVPDRLDGATAAALARDLREMLTPVRGKTATTLVAWLDAVLSPG